MKVAINGFGRIGRNSFRAAQEYGAGFDMVAVNGLTTPRDSGSSPRVLGWSDNEWGHSSRLVDVKRLG